MIDQIDRQLVDWIGGILKQADVSLAPPVEGETAAGVGLYLMELVQSQPARTVGHPPLLMKLRYLVTTHAAKPEDAHAMLAKLVVDALEEPEFEVEEDPLPLALWQALGIAPRPSFVLRVPFTPDRKRPKRRVQLVTKPLVIEGSPFGSIVGQVFGPDKTPLMNARVELPALALYTSTDSKGRFRFSAVPARAGKKTHLLVRARGQEFTIHTDQAGSEQDPLEIILKLEG